MILTLPGPRARVTLIVCSWLLAGFLFYFPLRNAVASYYLGLDTREGYEKAVRLEPDHARDWYLLGRSYLYDFEQPDADRAIEALRKAVNLDPYSAEALLDLATAYDGEGETAKAREAFLEAKHVYPLSADVAWSYGNFLLRQGEQEAAFREIREAVSLEPKRAAEAFSRAMRVQPDANVLLDRAVPASTAVYLPILHALSDGHDLDDAQLVWKRLLALHQKVPIGDMVVYIDELIHERRPGDAASAWAEAVSIMQNPPPPDPAGSLLWDGGFESGYAVGGFSWRFTRTKRDVQIKFDRSEKHSGAQSLRILFNGQENLNFEDACHNINPESGRQYLLRAWVKTQSLTSMEGVRLQIFAFSATKESAGVTEEIHGTQPWQLVQLRWTAPQDASFGSVCVKRLMSDKPESQIQGAAWLDDVSLTPVTEESTAR